MCDVTPVYWSGCEVPRSMDAFLVAKTPGALEAAISKSQYLQVGHACHPN